MATTQVSVLQVLVSMSFIGVTVCRFAASMRGLLSDIIEELRMCMRAQYACTTKKVPACMCAAF